MLSELAIVLGAAALLIGLTGAWSPCGFSMVETIGPTGHTGGQRTTFAACATFAIGAPVGGVLTFGLLALLGDVAHGAGAIAYGIAAAIALTAALAEARGVPIIPQIRRQLPEHWRRLMPMPLAAGLYGVLLGLGFTTFVLSFGVWALAGISFALGDPAIGLALGTGFGIGRALPIIALAPLAGKPAGIRATVLMAEKPGIYRGFRFGDALALVVAAAVLGGNATALAAHTEAGDAADPDAEAGDLVYQLDDGGRNAVLRRSGVITDLSGTDPAIGGPYIATLASNRIDVFNRTTLAPVTQIAASNVDAVAISGSWVAYRTRNSGTDRIHARDITTPGTPGPVRDIAERGDGSQLGRPSLDGSALTYAIARKKINQIERFRLAATKNKRSTLVSSHKYGICCPTLNGGRMFYVRAANGRSYLLRKRLGGDNTRVLWSTANRMWNTTYGNGRVFVTILRSNPPDPKIVSRDF